MSKDSEGTYFVAEPYRSDILKWLASGKTLTAYCNQEGTPSTFTIRQMRYKDKTFHEDYMVAREIGMDALADEALHIADTPSFHKEDVKHRTLQVNTRIQLLAKWAPHRYGNNSQLVLSGELKTDGLGDAERIAKVQALLAVAAKRSQSIKVVDQSIVEDQSGGTKEG